MPRDKKTELWQRLEWEDWTLHREEAARLRLNPDEYSAFDYKRRGAELHKIGRKPPDEDLFAAIMRLAEVPASGAASLRDGLVIELVKEWESAGELSPMQQVREEFRQEFRPGKAALKRLVRYSSKLSTAFQDLPWGALGAIRHASITTDRRGIGPGSEPSEVEAIHFYRYVEQIAELNRLLSLALKNLENFWGPPRPRGRPPGRDLFNRSLPLFVLRLLWDVRAAGGKLTFDKNQHKGTLVEALKLLRPYLPPGFVPKKNELPWSTLANIKALDKKIFNAAQLANNFSA